ncbi:hypothetical protein SLE2022_142960 [Rubroshorea leprosula]
MSCVQANLCIKSNERMINQMNVRHVLQLRCPPSNPFILPIRANHLARTSIKLSAAASPFYHFTPLLGQEKDIRMSKFHKRSHVCALGGNDNPAIDNEGSPWKATEKAQGNFEKESPILDVLKDQMQKKEYYDGGKGSSNPPRGRGGGGGGSGNDQGPEDESLSGVVDETMKVVLATIGIIVLYACVINGEEYLLLMRDYITFLSCGNKSTRLIQVMDKWRRFYEKLTEKKVYDKYWLEKAIISIRTMYRRALRSSLTPNSDDSS